MLMNWFFHVGPDDSFSYTNVDLPFRFPSSNFRLLYFLIRGIQDERYVQRVERLRVPAYVTTTTTAAITEDEWKVEVGRLSKFSGGQSLRCAIKQLKIRWVLDTSLIKPSRLLVPIEVPRQNPFPLCLPACLCGRSVRQNSGTWIIHSLFHSFPPSFPHWCCCVQMFLVCLCVRPSVRPSVQWVP